MPKVHACCSRCCTVYAFDFNWVPRDGSCFITPHGCWVAGPFCANEAIAGSPVGKIDLQSLGDCLLRILLLKIRYPSPITLNPLANHHFSHSNSHTVFPIQIAIPDFHTRWELKSWLASFPYGIYEPDKWWPRAMQFSGTLPFWYVDICRLYIYIYVVLCEYVYIYIYPVYIYYNIYRAELLFEAF